MTGGVVRIDRQPAITKYKRNDRLPEYTATLLQGDDTPIDLTAVETVKFHMFTQRGLNVKINAEAAIVSAADGTVKYQWAIGDLEDLGKYYVEWELEYTGSRTMTVPADGWDEIWVGPDLA